MFVILDGQKIDVVGGLVNGEDGDVEDIGVDIGIGGDQVMVEVPLIVAQNILKNIIVYIKNLYNIIIYRYEFFR